MMFIAILIAVTVTAVVGYALARILGWPSTSEGAGRWGFALLMISLMYSALPNTLGALVDLRPDPDLPKLELMDAFPALFVIGLAVLGHVAWTRGTIEREERARRSALAERQPRMRVLPPAPNGAPVERDWTNGGFVPRGTRTQDPSIDPERD